MTSADIIILLILGTAIAFIVRRNIQKRKRGETGCAMCSNTGCPSHRSQTHAPDVCDR